MRADEDRPDDWSGIPDGAGMTKEALRKIPRAIAVRRPMTNTPSATGDNVPPDCARFDEIHSRRGSK